MPLQKIVRVLLLGHKPLPLTFLGIGWIWDLPWIIGHFLSIVWMFRSLASLGGTRPAQENYGVMVIHLSLLGFPYIEAE